MTSVYGGGPVVDLVPFLRVTNLDESIRFYRALGFEPTHIHPDSPPAEFAELVASSSAKLMLARVDERSSREAGDLGPGFLYFFSADLDRLRRRLTAAGFDAGKIEPGPPGGPDRQICVRAPEGYYHMIAELFEGSIGALPEEADDL